MRLQRIYSSKLYVTSSRKDKIHAAIQDPLNVELVQQLEEYLSDEGKVELKRAVSEEEREIEKKQEASDDFEDSPSVGSGAAPSGGSHHSSFTGDALADFGDHNDFDDIPDMEEPSSEPTPDAGSEPEPVESVTHEGEPITSSTAIIWTTTDDVVSDCDTIKGTLNFVEATNGVIRLEVKDSELWIYFNDEVNLNDKMIDVIARLNSTGYTYLKFNRLARSNNAIVFDITLSVGTMKSKEELDKEAN